MELRLQTTFITSHRFLFIFLLSSSNCIFISIYLFIGRPTICKYTMYMYIIIWFVLENDPLDAEMIVHSAMLGYNDLWKSVKPI